MNSYFRPMVADSSFKTGGDFIRWIVFLLGVTGVFALLGTVFILGVSKWTGVELDMLTGDTANQPIDAALRNTVRVILGINHLFMYLIPPLIVTLLIFSKDWLKWLRLDRLPTGTQSAMGVISLIIVFPMTGLLFWLNQQLPLPEWALNMESDSEALLATLMTMDSVGEFLLSFFVIAVLPGVGEELLFRGALQNGLSRFTGRPYLSAVVIGFLFSAIHFQFMGFLPRWWIGTVFGLLFVWTKSLWLPIILHILFNGSQVIGAYWMREKLGQPTQEALDFPGYGLTLFSIIGAIALGFWWAKNRTVDEELTLPQSNDTA